jgi:hypothetical protein
MLTGGGLLQNDNFRGLKVYMPDYNKISRPFTNHE